MKRIVFNKLLLQAEEAREQGLRKLARGILAALPATPEEEINSYSSLELEEDVYYGLWALASNVIKYYDVESVDSQKLHEAIESVAAKFISEVQTSLGTDELIAGPLEPLLPGQIK